MIFEVDAEQIVRLDSVTLVQLMRRLLLVECQLVDIPLRATAAPLQITVPDGGEDGRVEWTEGLDQTNYFPSRFCIFQSKAQNLTESILKRELAAKAQKTQGKRRNATLKLNAALAETLARRGSYIVFCSKPFTGQKIEKLRKALLAAVKQSGASPSRLTKVDIYDANKIADWVNSHPAVALWLTSKERRRSLSGFQSHEGWGKYAQIGGVPWFDNDARRFLVGERNLGDNELDLQRGTSTFREAAETASTHLSGDKSILRIVGPSGFGKTRFAYEMFNQTNLVADQVRRASVIYADLVIVGDELTKLAVETADAGSPTILVVDNCPDDIHSTLAECVLRQGSRLRLVSIEVETRMQQAERTMVISLRPAPDDLIGGIAKGIVPALKDSDVAFIRELSNGFPRMAVLAAQCGGKRRETITSIDQTIERIVWGNRAHSERTRRVLELASMFEWLGISGQVAEQSEYVARELAGVPVDLFVEDLKSLKPRGILAQRGNFIQVQPIPLAARLAAARLSLFPDGKLWSFFTQAPTELKLSLLRRFRWLDTSPIAQAFAKQMLDERNLGNFTALNSQFGSEIFDHLVHISPDSVIATLDRVLGNRSLAELREFQEGRRHIVWALEKLVFRNNSFESAATLQRRLGAAETEARLGNSASGQFKGLYQLHLSGTEASPEDRLRVLDAGLKSTEHSERELCMEALGRMLQTGHFSRSGGSEQIGSAERLEDWTPKINGDIWNFHLAAMNRLAEIATSDDPFAEKAQAMLGSHLRGLLNSVPFDDVCAVIKKVENRLGTWTKAIQSVNSWLFFDRKNAPPDLGEKIRTLYEELLPSDPVGLVKLYTHGWQTDLYNPDTCYEADNSEGNDYDYGIREACKLADTIVGDAKLLEDVLQQLVTSDGKTIYAFALQLAVLAADPVNLFEKAVRIAEDRTEQANRSFFRGVIAGTDQRNPQKARDCLRAALRSPKLKDDAIFMIGAGTLQSDDLRLVVSLLQSSDVQPSQCAALSYGRGLDHLSSEEIMPLLDELGRHGANGHWTVIEIISMYLYGGKSLSKMLAGKLRTTLLAPTLFQEIPSQDRIGSELDQSFKLLLQSGEIDEKFVAAFVKQLLSICQPTNRTVFFEVKRSVRSIIASLLPSYSVQIWSEVSKLLVARDPQISHKAEQLFRQGGENNLSPGILHALPPQIYLDWVRQAPNKRAGIVVGWLPITTTGSDGTLAWHYELLSYIDEFGDQRSVLVGLAHRLYPTIGWGSVAPHLEPFLPLLEKWVNTHTKPEVRRWARDYIQHIKDEIDASRKRDEERNAGIR